MASLVKFERVIDVAEAILPKISDHFKSEKSLLFNPIASVACSLPALYRAELWLKPRSSFPATLCLGLRGPRRTKDASGPTLTDEEAWWQLVSINEHQCV